MARLDPEDVGLHSLKPKPGSRSSRRRVGRGEGSGHGKTSGRGHKGAGSRSGSKRKLGYEGGQNPINLVKATMEGLTGLRRPEQVAKLRGLSVNQVLGIQKDSGKTETIDDAAEQAPVTPEAVAAATDAEASPDAAPPAEETPNG